MTRQSEAPDAAPLGRKRDPLREAQILEATLEVLAEVGAGGLTMDLVAARAGAGKATIYRRWPSKTELVIDAVRHMKRLQVDLDQLPDTGSLREDLLGLFKQPSLEESGRKLTIMAGLATLLRRAAARGEIAADADLETLAAIIPSLAAYRTLVQRKAMDRAFLVSVIDGVLLPALRR
jgi:AcrR family transcriptional regulator